MAGMILGMVPVLPQEEDSKMTEKRGFSSLAALAIARAQKQLAEEYDDADLALNAIKLERRARWKRSSRGCWSCQRWRSRRRRGHPAPPFPVSKTFVYFRRSSLELHLVFRSLGAGSRDMRRCFHVEAPFFLIYGSGMELSDFTALPVDLCAFARFRLAGV
jgi:hypothetical protein